jgi:SAM-dependent methyltransferase
MWLYLSAQLRRGRQDGGPLKLLHIAPSFALQQALASFPRVVKVTCDRFREDVGLRLDMGVMPFPGQTFDAIVCSHVLEHVEDDRGAMAELFRVLDRDGWAVVLVPIARAPVAFDEDGGSDVSAFERWRRFGQDDHVRLYTRHALIDRLQSAGFDVRVLEAGAGFDNRRLRGAALTPTSALYIAEPRGVIG